MTAYRNHLQSTDDLVTTYEATRAGFVALALEKNRRATPYVAEARALQAAATQANSPADLLNIQGIETAIPNSECNKRYRNVCGSAAQDHSNHLKQ